MVRFFAPYMNNVGIPSGRRARLETATRPCGASKHNSKGNPSTTGLPRAALGMLRPIEVAAHRSEKGDKRPSGIAQEGRQGRAYATAYCEEAGAEPLVWDGPESRVRYAGNVSIGV